MRKKDAFHARWEGLWAFLHDTVTCGYNYQVVDHVLGCLSIGRVASDCIDSELMMPHKNIIIIIAKK